MKQIPPDAVAYKRTREFSRGTIPKGLLRRHSTGPGVWGRIRVQSGELLYRILEPEPSEFTLTPDTPGVIEPAVPHEVEAIGEVRFFVEFLKRPDRNSG